MNLTELINYINNIPSSTLLVGMIIFGVVVGWFLSNRKDIKALWDSWYQKKKRNDELLEMLLKDHSRMDQYEENRKKDRSQSFDIQKQLVGAQEILSNSHQELVNTQKQLAEAIVELKDSDKKRDEIINAMVTAVKEMLCDRINQKYKYYLSIGGIPEDEVEEFVAFHQSYKKIGGNHTGDMKFEYVMKNLPIIHVETALVFDDKEEH